MPDKEDTFYIGLCMAGAVSAGAYTAGVMDYLLEALYEWEKRRGQPGVPDHKVQIPVMGGASAGGMTAILTAAILNNKFSPVDKPSADLMEEHPENKLYSSWVDMTDRDMIGAMLDTADIESGNVRSLFNSDFIDRIAEKVVSVDRDNWLPLPQFIKPGLKLFTTLTNLEGYSYSINFNATGQKPEKYYMVVHNDYGCFQLTEQTVTGNNKGWIPLDFKHHINVNIAKDAAIATGAFPIALRPRYMDRNINYVNNNEWLKKVIVPDSVTNHVYNTLNIDGGLINNEPFEKVREVLTDVTGQTEDAYEDFNLFSSTVLMVDPFPTTPPTPILKRRKLLNVMGLTFSAMLDQIRSKPEKLSEAMNENCAGQFLIAPSRKVKLNGETTSFAGERALACGAINGFSGFLNKELRVHDYFLGRFNCKIFLRDYFTIPAQALEQNPIFKKGYIAADKAKHKSTVSDAYQIIPVFADATDYSFPDLQFKSGRNWPCISEEDLKQYNGLLRKRVQSILINLLKLNSFNRFLVWIGAKIVLNRIIVHAIFGMIKEELLEWKLLKKR